MSLGQFLFPKNIYFSGMWRYLMWQKNTDVLNLPTSFILGYFCTLRAEKVGSSETSAPVYCSPPPNRPYAWHPVTKWPELTVCPVRLTIVSTYKGSRGSAASNVPLCVHNEAAIGTKYVNISSQPVVMVTLLCFLEFCCTFKCPYRHRHVCLSVCIYRSDNILTEKKLWLSELGFAWKFAPYFADFER